VRASDDISDVRKQLAADVHLAPEKMFNGHVRGAGLQYCKELRIQCESLVALLTHRCNVEATTRWGWRVDLPRRQNLSGQEVLPDSPLALLFEISGKHWHLAF
jgi:hypothetical protein